MRLIDADGLMNCVVRKHSKEGKIRYIEGFNDAILRVRSMIHSAKTIDAVPVVRCKDCMFYSEPNPFIGKCKLRGDYIFANDFCSYAVRRKEDQ